MHIVRVIAFCLIYLVNFACASETKSNLEKKQKISELCATLSFATRFMNEPMYKEQMGAAEWKEQKQHIRRAIRKQKINPDDIHIDIPGRLQRNVYEWATEHDDINLLKELLSKRTTKDRKPLNKALTRAHSVTTAQCILEQTTEIPSRFEEGLGEPLLYYCKNFERTAELVPLYIKHGLDPWVLMNNQTLLHCLAHSYITIPKPAAVKLNALQQLVDCGVPADSCSHSQPCTVVSTIERSKLVHQDNSSILLRIETAEQELKAMLEKRRNFVENFIIASALFPVSSLVMEYYESTWKELAIVPKLQTELMEQTAFVKEIIEEELKKRTESCITNLDEIPSKSSLIMEYYGLTLEDLKTNKEEGF